MFDPDRYVAALRFAATRHAGQRVLDSELPYLVHLTAVAGEVAAGLPATPAADPDLAIGCALLHDVLEDTPTTAAELAAAFGDAITAGVAALTKDARLAKPDQMADSLRRIRAQPPAVWMVKLCDRIANLAPPPARWSSDKRRAYHAEAIEIADALAGPCPALDARLRTKIAAYPTYF